MCLPLQPTLTIPLQVDLPNIFAMLCEEVLLHIFHHSPYQQENLLLRMTIQVQYSLTACDSVIFQVECR